MASSVSAQDVDISQPLARGVEFIQSEWAGGEVGTGVETLSAYALLKAGQPENAPFVSRAVASVRSRIPMRPWWIAC